MESRYFRASQISEPAGILRSGGLVVFPTETVYGIGADARNADACARLFEIKGRPPDNPLIVHLSHISELLSLTRETGGAAERLFKAFSPGPLTLVLPKTKEVPSIVTAGLDTVAVRIPSHPIAQALIRESECPVAAPSANRSGEPSPTNFFMAKRAMDGLVDAIIDGGNCEIGLESTVAELRGHEVRILRPGAVTREMFEEALDTDYTVKDYAQYPIRPGSRQADSGPDLDEGAPRSPGQKYLHYKPHADVFLSKEIDAGSLYLKLGARKAGVILFKPDDRKRIAVSQIASVIVYTVTSVEEYARILFQSFSAFDEAGCSLIICEVPPREGLGQAVRNRLYKASGASFWD